MDRRVAHDALVQGRPPRLELGLDQRHDGDRRPGRSVGDRPEDEPERDERHVDDGQVDRLRQDAAARGSGRWSARATTTRGVAPEPVGELATPDVDGVDPPAPRCSRTSVKPPVEAPASRQTRPAGSMRERIERGRELVAAAADIGIALINRDRHVGGSSEIARLPVAPRGVALARPGPCRRGSAPGPGSATRPGPGRRGAGPACGGTADGCRSSDVSALTGLSWHSPLRRRHPAAGRARQRLPTRRAPLRPRRARPPVRPVPR